MLKLYEEMFLLSINDAKGQLVGAAASYMNYDLASAILAELALLGNVQADRKRLAVADATSTGDELLDETLATIATSPKPRKPAHWIGALASGKLQKRVVQGLVAKNVLRIEEKRFLWVIPYEAYPQQDASAKYWLKARLRGAALGGEQPESRTVALLSLLKACRLLDLVFTKDEGKAAGQTIDALVGGDLFGDALAETLAELDGAAVAAMAAVTAACT
jgi:golgi phosphoprotein 3